MTKPNYLVKVKVGNQVKTLTVYGENPQRAKNYAQRLCERRWNISRTDFHQEAFVSVEERPNAAVS